MDSTVFKSGNSQAVRIPAEFRLPGKRVSIQRIGDSLLLTPIDTENRWPEGYLKALRESAVDETFVRHPQGEAREIPEF